MVFKGGKAVWGRVKEHKRRHKRKGKGARAKTIKKHHRTRGRKGKKKRS